jgi:elongator complex protein 1
LSSKKRYSEAARVLLDYTEDVREAVIALVQGNSFSEARRVVSSSISAGTPHSGLRMIQTSLNAVPELLTDIIYPGALESRAQIGEDINEMRDHLGKQVQRLRELRIKKTEAPGWCSQFLLFIEVLHCNRCRCILWHGRYTSSKH